MVRQFMSLSWRHLAGVLLTLIITGMLSIASGKEIRACKGSLSPAEYNALHDLFNSTNGLNWIWDPRSSPSTIWTFSTYNLTAPCTDVWQGLVCVDSGSPEVSACAVDEMTLGHRNLVGTLPSSMGNFPLITVLSLSNNNISGTIPSEMRLLSSLETLFLDSNGLTGSISSEFGNLKALLDLDLSTNGLWGTIPTELGQLSAMVDFYISENCLTGSVPTELGRLGSMTQLCLYVNQLTGPIPTELGLVSLLDELYIYNNYMTGPIPSQICLLTYLESFDLDTNLFSGSIPTEIGNVSKMLIIYLFQNMLTGELPSEIGMLTALQSMGLYANALSGNIPSTFANLGNLTTVYLYDNMLGGSIPPSLMLLKLNAIDVASNQLTGTIPSELSLLGNLTLLTLSMNHFTGTVPRLPALVELVDLSSNRLTGSLEFLSDSPYIKELNLAANSFVGPIPTFMASFRFIQSLNMSKNAVTGSIEALMVNSSALSLLQSVDLSQNSLRGHLPSSIFLLPTLQTIVLSQNCFSGSIPDAICLGTKLENVVMDVLTANCGNLIDEIPLFKGFVPKQLMSGRVPSCVWNSTTLKVLHMLGNGLSGSLSNLNPLSTFRVLAVGSNRLTGSIPLSFQLYNFTQLDFSINRLSGMLSGDLAADPATTVSYSLDTNRISGGIPSAFYQTFSSGVLNVLESNLFDCRSSHIPPSDANHNSYQCGSADLQFACVSWMAAVTVAIALYVLVGCSHDVNSGALKLWAQIDNYNLMGLFVWYAWFSAISVIALFGYVAFKLSPDWRTRLSTHSIQYLWTTTVAYLRDWQTVVFVLLLLLGGTVVTAGTLIGFTEKTILSSRLTATILGSMSTDREKELSQPTVWVERVFKQVLIHTVNIVVLTTVNAVYIVQATNSLTGIALFSVQAFLGVFKLFWSMIAIPRLVYFAHGHDSKVLRDWVFMVLFDFVGAPFSSAFCESSACFLYVLTAPKEVTYSFPVPILLCNNKCETFCNDGCTTQCSEECAFTASATESGSILPPFIYSYQCSSAVVTNYSSVLIFSYVVTGVLIPLLMLVFVTTRKSMSSTVSDFIGSMISKFVRCQNGAEAVELFRRGGGSSLRKFGRRMAVKYILDVVVLMTFGLASPLLAFAIVFQVVTYNGMNVAIMERFASTCSDEGIETETVRHTFRDGLTLHKKESLQVCFVMMGFIGVFWSLFVFDMIGDVYGAHKAGTALLAPLLMPVCAGIFVLKFYFWKEHRNADSSGLSEILNPVYYPQNGGDTVGSSGFGRL
jgi:Leucine-rich repeat (LRR) protein